MVKKIMALAIVSIFIFSGVAAYAATETEKPTVPPLESTKGRISRGMNNLLYGPVETPTNIDQTKTKGTAMERCTAHTKDGVERGIARVVGGVWQLATFWYSDPGCVTKAPASQQAKSVVK